MAAEINTLSTTDASNTDRYYEGQAPSTVNDGGRALEGLLARGFKDTIDGALTTGGTTTAYTCTLNRSSIAAWYTGLQFTVKWNATCGASPTINPTGSGALGAKSLYWPDGTQVAAGDLVANSVSKLYYDGTNVQVLSPSLVVLPARFIATDAITTVKIADNAVTGAKIAMGSDAQGDILYYNGTDYARLGAGTNGQVLTTGGAGANPSWAAAGLTAASQADMETATSTTTAVSPGRAQYHPGVAKAWCLIDGDATPAINLAAHNCDEVTDNGTGNYTVTLTTDMSGVTYAPVVGINGNDPHAANGSVVAFSSLAAGTAVFKVGNGAGTAMDPPQLAVCFFGDQA